jgi:lysozyme family protein
MANFNKCIEVILRHEGGFQKNPNDSGNYAHGKLIGTKYGISARAFPDLDIENLTPETAKKIYRIYYWNKMNLNEIDDDNKALQLFDHGVNAGVHRAVRMAQLVVIETPDGILGPKTARAINDCIRFTELYKQQRIQYYQRLANNPKNKKFLKSWLKRVESSLS